MSIYPSNLGAIILPTPGMNTGESPRPCYLYWVLESYGTGGEPIYREHCICGGHSTDHRSKAMTAPLSAQRVEKLKVILRSRSWVEVDDCDDLLSILDERDELTGQMENLEVELFCSNAQLEKQRPLVDAVMGANLFPAPTDGRTCIDSHEKIIRAALALREGEGK